MSGIVETVRRDPAGSGLLIAFPLLGFLTAFALLYEPDPHPMDVPAPQLAQPEYGQPPAEWRRKARPGDILRVPGRHVAYWGNPKTVYGIAATRQAAKPRAVVVHYTIDIPVVRLVRYQHNGDAGRGGHYGYHFYVDREGRILQGAPLSVRTNHVKDAGHRNRKPGVASRVDNRNSIGVTMVGGCVRVGTGFNIRCRDEQITPAQRSAGLAVIEALITRYSISPCDVHGHGDLQTDRAPFEGATLTREIRARCGK